MSPGRCGSTRARNARPEAFARRCGASGASMSAWSRRMGTGCGWRRRCRVDVARRPSRGHTACSTRPPSPAPTTSRRSGVRDVLLPDWYDDWVALERERLRALRAHALEASVPSGSPRPGRFGEATEAGLASIRDEPLRESAHRALDRRPSRRGEPRFGASAVPGLRSASSSESSGIRPSPRMEALVAPMTVGDAPRAAAGLEEIPPAVRAGSTLHLRARMTSG